MRRRLASSGASLSGALTLPFRPSLGKQALDPASPRSSLFIVVDDAAAAAADWSGVLCGAQFPLLTAYLAEVAASREPSAALF
ncbi:unnamed protein product [Heligmosomoides polygyrus]|uniref:Sulfatase domain-containing protein n=1 Tax=Heligmosomoides polygyrus TaxID=6339 RepID=A0A183FFW3_HELPZ|nr:unnamed protein product [Heligmosomoides polygyrus]